MFSDGRAFYRRACLFQDALRRNAYPSAASLAAASGCSRNTAQRTIDRLRSEFALPVSYDSARHGYVLTDPFFTLPFLTAGSNELTALLVTMKFAEQLGLPELTRELERLWDAYRETRPRQVGSLEGLAELFSTSSTALISLEHVSLIDLLELAAGGTFAEFMYQSPWEKIDKPRKIIGALRHLRVNDQVLYLFVELENGKRRVLNASFLHGVRDLEREAPSPTPELWTGGFGIWVGEPVKRVTAWIGAPASRYHARQRWHEEQVDSWEGDVLVRNFPSAVAPEVVRRLLSLGGALQWVEPEDLRLRVIDEAAALGTALGMKPSAQDSTLPAK